MVQTEIMNPKAISMGELYGEVNPSTQEWQDGLASEIMRRAATDESNDRKWIVFDGPVDALWIENMNTVLDDNMMLCLANGQRIKLRPQMRILFEVQDLAVASPATVSRCGIVYMTYEEVSWRPYVISWIKRMYADESVIGQDLIKILHQLFEDNVDEILTTIRSNWVEPIPTVDLQLVVSLCNMIECFLSKGSSIKSIEKFELKKKYVYYVFAFSTIWSLGCTISESQHEFINEYFRKKFQTVLIPNSENIFGFFLDTSGPEVLFRSWQEQVPEFVYEKDTPYFNLLVPTTDSVKFSYITQNLIFQGKQVFMTGSTGTGKSVVIQALLNEMKVGRKLNSIFALSPLK
jgi:dynein heavy chain, axonemal